ncbi:hypothetical protein EPO05_04875 [Patescibacteria group bacterium]|nr:MAG: hypothetical protein EPO05_04875 [Patescibacteria group bacterium]
MLYALFGVSWTGEAQAQVESRVKLLNSHHELFLAAVKGSCGRVFILPQVFARRRRPLLLSEAETFSFHSARRGGFGILSLARSADRRVVRDRSGQLWVVINIPNTLDNDKGNWRVNRNGQAPPLWLNIRRLRFSGLARRRLFREGLVLYGSYQRPEVEFESSDHEIKIRWKSNGIFGLTETYLSDDIAFIRWNGRTRTRTCNLEAGELGHFECHISGLPGEDRGSLSAVTRKGHVVPFNNDDWNFKGAFIGSDNLIHFDFD